MVARRTLFALALAPLVALASPAAGEPGLIDAAEAFRLARSGALVLVDVRSPAEWRATGLPAGALAATVHGPRGYEGFVARVRAALGGDIARPVATICAAGGRSARAAARLRAAGFRSVRDVSEGMEGRRGLPGWRARGLPVEPWAGGGAGAAPQSAANSSSR